MGELIGWAHHVGHIGFGLVWHKGQRGHLVDGTDNVGCNFAVDDSIATLMMNSCQIVSENAYVEENGDTYDNPTVQQSTCPWQSIGIYTVITTRMCCKIAAKHRTQYCNTLQYASVLGAEGEFPYLQ